MELVCPHCQSVNRVPAERLHDGPHCGRCSAALLIPPFPLSARHFELWIQRSDLPLLVDFSAAWCQPCRVFAPVLAEVASRFKYRVCFATLDIDSAPHLAERYGVRSVPSLVLFHRGLKVAQIAGALPRHDLEQWLQLALAMG